MRSRFYCVLVLIVFFSAIVAFHKSRSDIDADEYVQIGIHSYLRDVKGRIIKGAGGAADSTYRHPESMNELEYYFPNCCYFLESYPDGDPISPLRRIWYQFGGYVFLEVGLIKVEGGGPNVVKSPYPRVMAIDRNGKDITEKIAPR